MPRMSRHAPGLGKALINDRFGNKFKNREYIHSAELLPDQDKADGVFQSVTERSTLDDFLATAEMAGTEFTAERHNIHFVNSDQKGIYAIQIFM